jgi:hypothetical protein
MILMIMAKDEVFDRLIETVLDFGFEPSRYLAAPVLIGSVTKAPSSVT